MKKLMLMFAAICLLVVSSCEKSDSDDCKTGDLVVSNSSANPYRIYVEGVYLGMVQGNSMVSFTIDAGFMDLRAEQASGYILYPTVIENTASIVGCREYGWQIP